MDWDKWVKQPGMSPVMLDFSTKAMDLVNEMADCFLNNIERFNNQF